MIGQKVHPSRLQFVTAKDLSFMQMTNQRRLLPNMESFQTPWYKIGNDGEEKVVGGLVEVSVVLPDEMPHFDRE